MPFRFLTLFLISLMICGCSGEANLPAVTGKVTIDRDFASDGRKVGFA